MKKIIILLIAIFNVLSVFGQISSIPYESFIENAKKSILPIVGVFNNAGNLDGKQGTAVFLGHDNLIFFLTCEHVIAKKDSLNKTIGYSNNIFVKMDNKDGTASFVKLKIDTVDEKHDFALLSIDNTKDNSKLAGKVTGQYLRKSSWHNKDDFVEGNNVLYMGYPEVIKFTNKNYPISRIGIISQNIKDKNDFLIDGFTNHGHSGSPVFLIREKNRNLPVTWEYKLIGISTSFPGELGIVYEQNRHNKTKFKVDLNPGFTNVTKMTVIIPLIEKIYNIKY